jgi:large subunit ribosomal protein L22
MITASLKNYRQSPRKVRSVANLVRGKSAIEAMYILTFLPKKATGPLGVLLQSAVANAKNNFNIEKEGLFIKELRVDAGVTLKRSMPRARGSASRINKRSSHVLLTLAPIAEKPAKITRAAKAKIMQGKMKANKEANNKEAKKEDNTKK